MSSVLTLANCRSELLQDVLGDIVYFPDSPSRGTALLLLRENYHEIALRDVTNVQSGPRDNHGQKQGLWLEYARCKEKDKKGFYLKSETHYKDNECDGVCKYFNENGKMIEVYYYTGGESTDLTDRLLDIDMLDSLKNLFGVKPYKDIKKLNQKQLKKLQESYPELQLIS